MNKLLKYSTVIIFLVTLLAWAQPARAEGFSCEKFVAGGSYTLKEGETLGGDLCLIGGTSYLMSGSTVEGDVFVIGGTLQANGVIEGSLHVAGGQVTLGDTSLIEGHVNLLGGDVSGVGLDNVKGGVNRNFTTPLPVFIPRNVWTPNFSFGNTIWSLFWLPLRSFLWAALAVLAALFAHRSIAKVGRTAVNQAVLSGGMGLATFIVAITLMVALAITIVCIPFSFFLVLLFIFAWAFGIIALGMEVGQRLAVLAKQEWAPAVSAGLGVFLLTLALNGIALAIPCVGFIPQFLAGLVGLGAVVLTRFGSHSYPANQYLPPAAPPPVSGTQDVEPLIIDLENEEQSAIEEQSAVDEQPWESGNPPEDQSNS